MPPAPYTKYARSLSFETIDTVQKRGLLIDFGRDLYRESLGSAALFFRDYGPNGDGFPAAIERFKAVNAGFALFLTEDAAEIGLITLGQDGTRRHTGHIHQLYVRPDHRGRGFGGYLEDYARRTLWGAGFRKAALNVGAGNERALRFYQSLGWREVARRGALVFMETSL